MLGWFKKNNKAPEVKEKNKGNIDEMIESLPEDLKESAIVGAVDLNLTNKTEYCDVAIDYFLKTGYPKSTAAKTALKKGDVERAMRLEASGRYPWSLDEIAFKYDRVELGIELLEPLLESAGDYDISRLEENLLKMYEHAGMNQKAGEMRQLLLERAIERDNLNDALELASNGQKYEVCVRIGDKTDDLDMLIEISELIKSEDKEKADEYILKGVKTALNDRFGMGGAMFEMRHQKSFRDFLKSIKDDRILDVLEEAESYVLVAEMCEERGDLNRSIKNYVAAEKYGEAADICMRLKRYDQAFAQYRKGHSSEGMAKAAMAEGRYQIAIDVLTKDVGRVCPASENYIDICLEAAEKLDDSEQYSEFCKQGMKNFSIMIEFDKAAKYASRMGDEELAETYNKMHRLK